MSAIVNNDAPAWMETLESIKQKARPYEEHLISIINSMGGYAVTGSSAGDLVQDRQSGVVYLRLDGAYRPGEVIKQIYGCNSGDGDVPSHRWEMAFRVIRRVSIGTVRKLASRARGDRFPVSSGRWYQVHTD